MKPASGVRLMVGVLAGLWGGISRLHGQSLALSHPAMVFLARVGGGDPGPQSLSIRSTPAGSPAWTIPAPPPAWLSIAPAAGTGAGAAVLTPHSAGLGVGYYHVQLTVSSGTESKTVEVLLIVTDAAGNLPLPPINIPIPPLPPAAPPARYLVEFHFVGYSGLVDGYPNCKVNPNGRELMWGILSGVDPTEADEEAEYTGTMTRYTMVDFCDVKPKAGLPDEVVWCEMWLTGLSKMKVHFTVYAQEGRGGWLQAEAVSGGVNSLSGTCDSPVAAEIRAAYPRGSGGGGGSPDGQPIQDPNGRLAPQGLARLRPGEWPVVDQKEGQWSMRVVGRILP